MMRPMTLGRVLVVGAGLAGGRAAETLREVGFDGEIALVGAEPHLPYDRPPLSKELLTGKVDDTALRPADAYEQLGLDVRLGRRVAALHARHADLDDGSRIPFDAAVVTTGAVPRRLPGSEGMAGVAVLRTVDDARAIRDALTTGSPRVVVVGAGFIGAEVASSCRALGLDVTVLEAFAQPLERVLGPEMGAVCAGWHRDEGVDLRCGVSVAGLQGDGRVEAVVLADGTIVPADLVVVGIGVVPDVEFLTPSGAELVNGVVVDEHAATTVAGIWAAGDVANGWNPLFEERMRIEHWTNALLQAEVAARNVLGGDQVHAPVPYFWSDQYGMKLQYVGHASAWDRLVVRGDPATRKFDAFYLRGGRLLAVLCVGRPRDTVAANRLIAARAEPDPTQLADPDVDLLALSQEVATAGGAD
jgi:3-phenylpropionate/trans-cinnamate dioxygenase ferredoxin reductase subunit